MKLTQAEIKDVRLEANLELGDLMRWVNSEDSYNLNGVSLRLEILQRAKKVSDVLQKLTRD